MQKKIWFVAVVFFAWSVSRACDVCGGGLGSNFIGIAAQTTNNMVGLRLSNTTLHTTHKAIFRGEQSYTSFENYTTANVWARFYLNRKFQLFTFIPIHYFYKKEIGNSSQNAGVGDATLRLHYQLYNSFDIAEKKVKHSLQIGAGIKLPTSYHLKKENDTLLPVGMQMGSGSVDFPIAAIYNIRNKAIGMNLESSYSINTRNNMGYRFGDKWNNAIAVYYWIKHKRTNYIPKINATVDWYQQDFKNKYRQSTTGGVSTKIGFGFAIFYQKISIDAGFTLPVYEKLNGGLTKTKANFTLQFIYLI